jgi:hypothetical protein
MLVVGRTVRSLTYFASGLASESQVRRGKHCALIFDKRYQVVACYVNDERAHAEQGAIEMLPHGLSDLTLLVVRAIHSTGELGMSRPCHACRAAIDRTPAIVRCLYTKGCGEYGELC